jgi:YHS domain-containing protein
MEERLKIEHQPDRQCTTTAIVGAREIDPVCGMRLDPATLKHYFDIAGRRFHFCSADCRAKFEADPNAYHKRKAATSHPAKAGVTYTCPHGGSRQLPHLRHDARVIDRVRSSGAEQRSRRHDPTLLDRACANPAGLRPRNGQPYSRTRLECHNSSLYLFLGAIWAGNSCRPLGRMAVLSARLGVTYQPPPQHVYPHFTGYGYGLHLQSRSDLRSIPFPRGLPEDINSGCKVYH